MSLSEPLLCTESFSVFDIETTDKTPHARIVELALVRVEHNQPNSLWTTLVNPERAIRTSTTRIHHITNEMIAGAIHTSTALAQFFQLQDGLLVAHNVAFDQLLLEREARRTNSTLPRMKFLCTKKLAQKLLPALPSYSLASVAHALHVQLRPTHRAATDALVTTIIFLRLRKLWYTAMHGGSGS